MKVAEGSRSHRRRRAITGRAQGRTVSPYPIELGDDPERLARSVATWILFTAEELGEFRTTDLHPQIRARVAELVPDFVEVPPAS